MRNVSSVVLTNTIIIKWSLYPVLLLSLGLRRLFTAFHPKEKFINTSEKLNLEKVMLFRRWLCLKVERIYLHHVLELTFQSDFFFFLIQLHRVPFWVIFEVYSAKCGSATGRLLGPTGK